MTIVTQDDLAAYLVRLVAWGERFAITFAGVDDELTLGREPGDALVIDLDGRLPHAPRITAATISIFERWTAQPKRGLVRTEYAYELRDPVFDYRRALHYHDEDHFVRQFQVATHEHCEATMGVATCGRYFGYPVRDGIDGLSRLYDVWLRAAKPDCSELRCLS
ncbi:MAG: hypothetical protein ABIR11_13810 [Candidatus Limnocylindrales bacterium]